jgi:hypothetical protein
VSVTDNRLGTGEVEELTVTRQDGEKRPCLHRRRGT